jgi:hypothetical protein
MATEEPASDPDSIPDYDAIAHREDHQLHPPVREPAIVVVTTGGHGSLLALGSNAVDGQLLRLPRLRSGMDRAR